MQLQSAPGACPSINVAGIEYSPDENGVVDIVIPEHIAVAKREGFIEVSAPAEIIHKPGE